jgi:hypothetical protein
MKVSKFITFFLVFLLTQAVSLKSENILINGSFEDVGEDGKPTGWTCSGTNVVFGITTAVDDIPDGANVFSVEITNTTNVKRDISQTLAVVQGETYSFSFFSQVYGLPAAASLTRNFFNYSITFVDNTNFNNTIRWVDTDGDGVPDGQMFTSELLPYEKDEWMLFETEFTVPAGANQIMVSLNFHLGVDVYIDDVQLVKTNEVITGIPAVKAKLPVRSENGNLVVSGAPAGSRIDVYNLFGERLQSVIAATGETVIPNLPKGQVLIVRSGNEAAKVVL